MSDAGMEPSLDALIRQLTGGIDDNSGGWADLDPRSVGQVLAKMRHQHRHAMRAEASLFRDVFDTGPGRKLLELLLDRTLRRVAYPVQHLHSMDQLTAHGIWRDAENSFVAGIVEAIALAENGEAEKRDI